MLNRKITKKLNAFSLMEMVVTMGILAIVISMLSNVLINSILISQRSIARSFIREEVANIIDRLALDIRSASQIGVCEGEMEGFLCEIIGAERSIWRVCDYEGDGFFQVCKEDSDGNILYSSSPMLRLDQFVVDGGFETSASSSQRNILITLVGGHANESYAINNLIQQVAISSRNYILIR